MKCRNFEIELLFVNSTPHQKAFKHPHFIEIIFNDYDELISFEQNLDFKSV